MPVATRGEFVASEEQYERAAPAVGGSGQVHMLIVALDYKQTANPLSCSIDGRNMEELAKFCGIQHVVSMYDEQCTKPNVLRAIANMGASCGPDDYFIFYYSGHGTSVEDEDGDEEDGYDEAYCLVNSQGKISRSTMLTDDEFAQALVDSTDEEVRIVVLSDCCHSGTMADLDKDIWEGREAISISGCMDNQTSGDIGKGGIFTHSMLLAIDQLEDAGMRDYSVGLMYNATVKNDDSVFNSAQEISIQTTDSISADEMAWPLVPRAEVDYQAPLTKACGGNHAPSAQQAAQIAQSNPSVLAQCGVPAHLVTFIDASGLSNGKIKPQELLVAGFDFWKAGGCKQVKKETGCSIM